MYNSQDKQDEYLETNVFKGYKNGIFVDVGANNGLHINNTLYFEKYNNWTGINIEPIKTVYDQLVVNRPTSINLNCAVCNHDGETDFVCNDGYTEMISGIVDTYDRRHYDRLDRENEQMGSSTTIIKVPTKRLETIFDEHKISHVHYLSIDVEGAEFEVIKSINFDKVYIDIIDFENNYNDTSVPIVEYLEGKGFYVIKRTMDIFMIHKDSVFNHENLST
jgi:FkbM family methyltransferase